MICRWCIHSVIRGCHGPHDHVFVVELEGDLFHFP